MEFNHVFKFNKHHDAKGLFSTADGTRVGSETTMHKKDGVWVYSDGTKVPPDVSARLNAMHIPPAWKGVQLNADHDAALQAIGIDAKNRVQYRYSEAHSEAASAEKFARVKKFTHDLPAMRKKIMGDVRAGGASKEEAATLMLVEKTGFRIGSDRNTHADVEAFGASTLQAKHVKITGDTVKFSFIGKKGVAISKTVKDADLASMLAPRISGGGSKRLFNTDDRAVNKYLDSISGDKYKVKDFRTYHGTAVALTELKKLKVPSNEKEFKAQRLYVSTKVAAHLGNTPSVALASYIDPSVWKLWSKK